MRTIITIILALVAMTGLAQEIKMNETAISDYIPLLNAKGYQAYSLIIGFLPSETDSLAQYCFSWENTLSYHSLLKLKQIYWESENKYIYSYRSDPFEPTSPLEKETFIPLVYYSSFWYDAEDKVTRCCGSISDITPNCPHYYILGIKFY